MKMYNIIYINQDKTTEIKVKNGVPYIVFKNLELPGIVHGFSTRLGGVSEGIYSTMNLSFHRGDDMDAVSLLSYKEPDSHDGYQTFLLYISPVHLM